MGAQSPYAIGVDLGGTFIKAALVTSAGKIDIQDRRPTEAESGAEGVAARVSEQVNGLMARKGLAPGDLAGVGIGVPGVTTADGMVILAPNLNWHHVPFKRLLSERLGLRVELDNDANVAALAEARVGAGGGCDTFVLFTLGTGIGGGIILNGRVHHGASYAAGEVGHVCVMPDGPLCGCGKKGCLEAITAGPAMVRHVRDGLAKGQVSSLSGVDDLTPEAICKAADAGDALALETIAHVAFYLGIAIADIIVLLSPNVVAIGGGISAAGDVLLNPIIEATKAESLEGMFEHTKIVPATLGNDAGSLGAAFLVL